MIDLFNDSSQRFNKTSLKPNFLFNNFSKMFNKNDLNADFEQVTTRNFRQQGMCAGCSKQPLDQIPSCNVHRDAGHRLGLAEDTAGEVEGHFTAGKRSPNPVDVGLCLVLRR